MTNRWRAWSPKTVRRGVPVKTYTADYGCDSTENHSRLMCQGLCPPVRPNRYCT